MKITYRHVLTIICNGSLTQFVTVSSKNFMSDDIFKNEPKTAAGSLLSPCLYRKLSLSGAETFLINAFAQSLIEYIFPPPPTVSVIVGIVGQGGNKSIGRGDTSRNELQNYTLRQARFYIIPR